jgi:hypothetical protein
MKHVFLAGLLGMGLLFAGCGDEKKEEAVDPSLAVNVSYTGSQTVNSTHPIYFEIWTNAADLLATNYLLTGGFFDYVDSTVLKSFTVNGTIPANTYYFVAYVDVDGDTYLSTGDKYIIYNNVTKTGAPTALNINTDKSISITFGDTNTW